MVHTAVILAAGRGSRLERVTERRSKPMVPVLGLPMIQRVIDEIAAAGITNFLIVASPRDIDLRDYFKGRRGVTVLQQDKPLGSGDALKVCAGLISGDFLISACDSIVRASEICSLIKTHNDREASVSLGVMRVDRNVSLQSRSVVNLESDGRISSLIEKPKPEERTSDITALPLYICNTGVFKQLEQLKPSARGEYELTGVFSEMCGDPRFLLVGSFVNERIDLTNQSDLLELNRIYLRRQSPSVCIDPSAIISAKAVIDGPVWIGPRCTIEDHACVGPWAVLEGDNLVRSSSQVRDVLALRGAVIEGGYSSVVLV
jgi:NDP-sugar pyrophosphorylase family protein